MTREEKIIKIATVMAQAELFLDDQMPDTNEWGQPWHMEFLVSAEAVLEETESWNA